MRILRNLAVLLLALLLAGQAVALDYNAPIAAEAFVDDPALTPGSGTPLTLDGLSTDPFRAAAPHTDIIKHDMQG